VVPQQYDVTNIVFQYNYGGVLQMKIRKRDAVIDVVAKEILHLERFFPTWSTISIHGIDRSDIPKL
jgi:hypothetical protein